uniref:Ig-like domain-containing protein n=1 Tax=Anas zonorhyncha TaxID=75864 RepID=A0A8B9US60_9AVES
KHTFLPLIPHLVCDGLLQGAFLMHVASSCPLVANSSMVGFDFTLAFNKNQLECYDSDTQRFARRQHCVRTLHRAGKRGSPTTDPIPTPAPVQPQVHIIPVEMGNARVPVRLSCHIWGSYSPEVTVIWLHNRDIVEPDDYNTISAIPNGDWSYQTQVSLLVVPVAGDTYTCSDGSEWRGPGLMPEVTILVAVATVTLLTPLLPPAGYTPLPGDNYLAGNSVPIPVPIGEGRFSPSLALCVPPLPQAASEDHQMDTSRHRWLLVGPISDPMPWC